MLNYRDISLKVGLLPHPKSKADAYYIMRVYLQYTHFVINQLSIFTIPGRYINYSG